MRPALRPSYLDPRHTHLSRLVSKRTYGCCHLYAGEKGVVQPGQAQRLRPPLSQLDPDGLAGPPLARGAQRERRPGRRSVLDRERTPGRCNAVHGCRVRVSGEDLLVFPGLSLREPFVRDGFSRRVD